MTHYYVTFVVTVCREFFGGRNSSPHEVSGETTVDKRCDAWIYKTTVDKRYDAWIYNFTWKHLSLWWFLVLYEQKSWPCIFPSASPPTILLSYHSKMIQKSNKNKSKKFSEVKQAHVGVEASKPTKLDGNDTTTSTHHPHILCHFANYAHHVTNSLHALSLLICIEWTRYSALPTPQSYT